MDVIPDGLGHFTMKCVARNPAGIGSTLRFELFFDQTEIPAVLRQLESVVARFPARERPDR